MQEKIDDALRRSAIFRWLTPEDRQRIAAVATVREFDKASTLFSERRRIGFSLYRVDRSREGLQDNGEGRRRHPGDFGPGDPVGAVAVYESRPYPASAIALKTTSCLLIPRQAFFTLLETHPMLVRGLLVGLTHRLVELTNRLTELSGGRIEGRLARIGIDSAFVGSSERQIQLVQCPKWS